MTGQMLKWIAVIAMVLDHIGVVCIGSLLEPIPDLSLYSLYTAAVSGSGQQAFLCWTALIFRAIGRIAFPIFCFLLTEGFCHTKSIKKYMGRMAFFALISEIPFDLAIYKTLLYPYHQNVFFTLLIGLAVLYGMKEADLRYLTPSYSFFLKTVIVFAGCLTGFLFYTDYGFYGVLFIVLLYILRTNKVWQTVFGVLMAQFEYTAIFAFLPIWFYNGKPGKSQSRYFFYWFYPVHLLILGAIRLI